MAFVTISRLAAKRGFGGATQTLLAPKRAPVFVAPCHSIISSDKLSHEEKNRRLERPMSPHLSIYKPQLSSVLSISHRITGIVTSVYLAGFAGFALTASHDFAHYMTALNSMNLGSPAVTTLKFIIAFPFMYHTMNGVRHLLWDQGLNVSNKGVATTGTLMLSATAVTTLLALLL